MRPPYWQDQGRSGKDKAPASGKTGTNFHRNEYLLKVIEGRGTRKQYVIIRKYSFKPVHIKTHSYLTH